MNKPVAVVLAGAALSTGALAGGGTAYGATPLKHAAFVTQADQICTNAYKTIEALKTPKTLKGLATYSTQVAKASGTIRAQINALDLTASDRKVVTSYLNAIKASNGLLNQLASAASQGNNSQVRAIGTRLSNANVGALAARSGLAVCATSPGDASA